MPPSPPPPPPSAPGKTLTDPVIVGALPYTSPTMNLAEGGVGLSKVIGEMCGYNQVGLGAALCSSA